MTDGTFSSEARRWQWLQKLASLPKPSNDDDVKDGDIIDYIMYEEGDAGEEDVERYEEEWVEEGDVGVDDVERYEEEWVAKWEAKHLNYIWYELVEHPEFMRT
jgi:hypothetical protein